jgi:hypothetical protein
MNYFITIQKTQTIVVITANTPIINKIKQIVPNGLIEKSHIYNISIIKCFGFLTDHFINIVGAFGKYINRIHQSSKIYTIEIDPTFIQNKYFKFVGRNKMKMITQSNEEFKKIIDIFNLKKFIHNDGSLRLIFKRLDNNESINGTLNFSHILAKILSNSHYVGIKFDCNDIDITNIDCKIFYK